MSLLESPLKPQVKDFLKFLGKETIFHLSGVSTSNRVVPTSEEEAIEVILLHTRDVARLFSYKRIKSQSLYLYLHKNGIATDRSASKTQLMVAVQTFWEQQIQKTHNPNPSILKRRASDPSSPSSHSREARISRDGSSHYDGTVAVKHKLSREGPSSRSFSESSSSCSYVDNRSIINVHVHSSTTTALPFAHNTNTQKLNSVEFTRHFCEWFYSMLNRLQPECASSTGDIFSETIFLTNSSVDVFLIGQASGNDERHAQGPPDSCKLIGDVCRQYRLLFSPNVESGTQAHRSSYGMVKVLCCGTLFQEKSFIGIFEQEFGLVKCPMDRAWKIMYTKVNLKQTSDAQVPSLPPCQVFEIEDV